MIDSYNKISLEDKLDKEEILDQMREWMKNNNKDFYAIYYVNGIDYDMVK